MFAHFRLIFIVLLFATTFGGINGSVQCCRGYLREYDHSESCYWFENGRCCADKVVYSKKHGEYIGIGDARTITEEGSGICRYCFQDITDCEELK